ncbi:hypothetical protein ACFLYA_00750 [Candidatus Dependentiae bacterium]
MKALIKGLLISSMIFAFAESKDLKVDLIAFSYNRPLQLHSFFESVDKYVSGLNNIYVIYRSGNLYYDQAYEEVMNIFKDACFVRQGKHPRKDFKPLLLQCFYDSPSEYIVFAVDDIIVKDYFDISECLYSLKHSDAYGFYLRLGENVTTNYNGNARVDHRPPLEEISESVYRFRFNEGKNDWAYPNTVDMTIYKKSEIERDLKEMNYSSPNTLEGVWASRGDLNKFGLCFSFSKIINIPLNIVQEDWRNPHNNSLTAKVLLDTWNDGLKIDIDYFFRINNSSPHIQEAPVFIER